MDEMHDNASSKCKYAYVIMEINTKQDRKTGYGSHTSMGGITCEAYARKAFGGSLDC